MKNPVYMVLYGFTLNEFYDLVLKTILHSHQSQAHVQKHVLTSLTRISAKLIKT